MTSYVLTIVTNKPYSMHYAYAEDMTCYVIEFPFLREFVIKLLQVF